MRSGRRVLIRLDDSTTIDLNLIPQVVEFEGFINYVSPINGVGPRNGGLCPNTWSLRVVVTRGCGVASFEA